MTQMNLWSRLGSWINPFPRDDAVPDLARADLLTHSHSFDEPDPTPSRPLFRGRRDQVLDRMQTGYDKILDLVESIQDHLVHQSDRSDKVVTSLNDLAQGVKDLPDAARRNAETLGKVAGQVEVSNSHAQVMIGVLRDWPSASIAQKQALESISEHLRASAGATQSLSQRLQALDRTVSTLGQAAGEQIQTLKALQRSAQHQEAQLMQLLTAQTRRLALFFGLAATLSGLALVIAATVLFG